MYEVAFNHVLGDFVTESDELLLGQFLGDLVVHADVAEYLPCSAAPNPMDVLQRVLHSLVVGYLHSSHTHALDAQTPNLPKIEIFKKKN